jgi:dTDP-4-dehydrorhamnose 3,5-epimerase
MNLVPTPLAGACVIDLEPLADERGFFARSFCRREFADHGLNPDIDQCSVSFNAARGTLRGMHFQIAPGAEDKLVRCTAGAIFDVIVDIRRTSASFGRWFGVELSAANRRQLYIPKGFAHGFLTLAEQSEVFYQISVPFLPTAARGLNWNDPAIGIGWPFAPSVVSARDAALPVLADADLGADLG